jgi:osmotically inducible protein OsmC
MITRKSSAVWQGTLKAGNGNLSLGSGAFNGQYSFNSRFESGTGTNPEELIGAAEAACFSMALAANLEKAGAAPKRISTTAKVNLDKGDAGFSVVSIELETEAEVSGIDEAKFQEQAALTKQTCPISKALAGTEIKLKAVLKK